MPSLRFVTCGAFITIVAQVTFADSRVARSSDGVALARIRVERGREELVLQKQNSVSERIVWKSPAALHDGSVEYGKERIFKMVWCPQPLSGHEHLLAVATERQRYRDVYDSRDICVFSDSPPRLLWKQILGLRWEGDLAWSPRSTFVGTVTVSVQESPGDVAVIWNSQTGRRAGQIVLRQIQTFAFRNATQIGKIRFRDEEIADLILIGKTEKDLFTYSWRFRR